MRTRPLSPSQSGFTLIEVAIAVMILGLLLGGAVMTLSVQMDQKSYADTQRIMEQAQDAILGFAAANGRLPCPGTNTSLGKEAPTNGGDCSNDNGFVPANTLSLSPQDSDGRLLDAWGQPIRYAVTNAPMVAGNPTNAFTTPGKIHDDWLSALDTELLVVCDDTAVCNSTTTDIVTNRAVVVLVSGGKDMSQESENTDADRYFNYRPISSSTDDLMRWVSPFTLYNRMLSSGVL